MRVIFFLAFALLTYSTYAQDARQILQQSFEKCQSVQNGHYVMTRYMKYMSEPDTVSAAFDCHFKKIENDPNFSVLFHYKQFHQDIYTSDLMYTGEEYAWTSVKDSSAVIMSRNRWPEELKSFSDNPEFFSPLTTKKSSPIPRIDDPDFKDQIFTFVGEQNVNGKSCYYIQVEDFPKNEQDEMIKTLRIAQGFWINKEDIIPLQYTTTYNLMMGPDSMVQYEKLVLNKYDLNTTTDDEVFALESIPPFYTMKDYVPYTEPDPLAINSSAPDWALPALNDERVHLSRLKGKVVLIDFFYKACFPCLLALPGLQSLHEKYKDQGLFVVGINPVDGKESGIEEFMAKKGVTYTILLAGEDLADKYRVSGYPTMFLLDRSGKIVFIQSGYGPDMEKKLEKMIKKFL